MTSQPQADPNPVTSQSTSTGSPHSGPIQESPSTTPVPAAGVQAPNIVIFGDSGVGKSSVINLIAGEYVARTSDAALGCTFQHERYNVQVNGTSLVLWDTAGLNEGTQGTIPATQAENYLKVLIQALADSGGIHLLLYCIRPAGLARASKQSYDLFYVAVCRKKVPIALVVTGLEHQLEKMELWWDSNAARLSDYGMYFDAHACVTTLNHYLENPVMRERRAESQDKLRKLIVKFSTLPARTADPSLLSTVLPTLRGSLRRTAVDHKTRKSMTTRRVVICDMEPGDITSDPGSSLDSRILKKEMVDIEDHTYELIHVDQRALEQPGVKNLDFVPGVLVFRANSPLSSQNVHVLETFYNMAGGRTCPLIVVLQECENEQLAIVEFWKTLASQSKSIQAYPTVPSRLNEVIERLCIERVEFIAVSAPGLWRRILNSFKRRKQSKGAEKT